jgi:hypothetical protein
MARLAASSLLASTSDPAHGVSGWRATFVGSAHETLHGYVSDMMLVERELLAAIRRQRECDSTRRHRAAHRLLERIEHDLDEHIATLTQTLEAIEGDASVVTGALGAILGAAAVLFDRVRLDTELSRMLRDDYAGLSFASVCYEMLHATALWVDEPKTAELALRHLADHARSIMEIGGLIPSVLLAELQEQGTAAPDPAVVAQAQRNVRAAWSSEEHHADAW